MKTPLFPINLRTTRSTFFRLGLAAFAVVAQFAFHSHAVAAPGDLYVTDAAAGTVVIYAPDGTSTTFATGLISPQDIVFDMATTTMPAFFYVADIGNGGSTDGVIYRYDRTGNRTTFKSGLDNPIGLALDGAAVLVTENGADRVQRLPVDGSLGTISLLVSNPIGIDTRAFGQSGFTTKFIATGDSVLKVDPGTVPVDIDPNDGSRSLSVDPVLGDVYITTDAGTITKVANDGTNKTTLTSGLIDPHGLIIVPPGAAIAPGLYVADTGAGTILRVLTDGSVVTYVADAGAPNYLTSETESLPDPLPTPTPSPSPSVSPSPSPSPSVSPSPTPAGSPIGRAQNISSRVNVQTGEDVGIGGFIITGDAPKTVAIRAIGPALTPAVVGALEDPTLELRDSDANLIANNDNWMDNSEADQAIIVARGLAPASDFESVIIATLDPLVAGVAGSGQYTAIMRGVDGTTGIALIEIYDLDDPSIATDLANLSTRGTVGTGDDVLIGGVIVGPPSTEATFVIRAIGPSLAPAVMDVLDDPVLELRNADADVIAANDDWQDDPDNADKVSNADLAPTADAESAIFANLIAGSYTAIVRGAGDTSGIGLVEIYHLQDASLANK
ncbi:MAG: hypothetical protein M3Q46_04955 [Verrucomicrobiota bacterium]|nr:hypothetical protein [Verrucomicrobiota bacterium]